MHDVVDFVVSYAEPDAAWAAWIGWQLATSGYSACLHVWPEGSDADGFRTTHERTCTLALLSNEYLTSSDAMAELRAALRDERLLPVYIEAIDQLASLETPCFCNLIGYEEPAARAVLIAVAERALLGPEPSFPGADRPEFREPLVKLAFAEWEAGRSGDACRRLEGVLGELDRSRGPEDPDTRTARALLTRWHAQRLGAIPR